MIFGENGHFRTKTGFVRLKINVDSVDQKNVFFSSAMRNSFNNSIIWSTISIQKTLTSFWFRFFYFLIWFAISPDVKWAITKIQGRFRTWKLPHFSSGWTPRTFIWSVTRNSTWWRLHRTNKSLTQMIKSVHGRDHYELKTSVQNLAIIIG